MFIGTAIGELKVVWKAWDLRSLILISLGFQILLIFIGPVRKRTSNGMVAASIWGAYLLADYVAFQAVSLIPNSSALRSSDANYHPLTHPDLLAFWSPFLLVHLGGPDTITAIALEDNELWMRTALHLGTQVLATSRVLFLSLPSNILRLPTLLMFVAGFLKYMERICSLFDARVATIKSSLVEDPDPGPDYAAAMEVYDFYLSSYLPTTLTVARPSETPIYDAWIHGSDQGYFRDQQPASMGNVQLLRDALMFFHKFKFLYLDLIFGLDDWEKSRPYFKRINTEDAMRILEVELNFTYEEFFTKMVLIHRTFWKRIRFVSVICQGVSLVIWALLVDKQGYHSFDVCITYILLGGAILLDALSFVRIMLSDYKIATLYIGSKKIASFYDKLLSVRNNRTWSNFWSSKESPYGPRLKRFFFRRWSESLLQFNLINYCANSWSDSAKLFLRTGWVKDKCDGLVYVSSSWFPDELRDFIFLEIMQKSDMIFDLKAVDDMCNSKGEWVLRLLAGSGGVDPSVFYPWTVGVQYDECLLLWHVATELLYQKHDGDDYSETDFHHRKYCKTLSDYMMYLLIWQSKMMLPVAGISEVRFRHTCAEATNFLNRVMPKSLKPPGETKEERLQKACNRMMGVNTETSPKELKGDKYKSVLFDAVRLAKCLLSLNENAGDDDCGMWEVMAKVWVELLCYSAVRCRPNEHAAQLKQGGQLLTIVWLFMVHLGLGKHFRVTQNTSTSKIVRQI